LTSALDGGEWSASRPGRLVVIRFAGYIRSYGVQKHGLTKGDFTGELTHRWTLSSKLMSIMRTIQHGRGPRKTHYCLYSVNQEKRTTD